MENSNQFTHDIFAHLKNTDFFKGNLEIVSTEVHDLFLIIKVKDGRQFMLTCTDMNMV